MSFIKTFSGKHFYYDKINKDDIDINDIAVSLSNICRFAGHLSHFYSVAQHAVLCSQLIGWRSLWYTWGQKETGEWQWTFQVGDLENVNITHWAVMPKAPEAGA
ncbi:TPA: hypothetical protein ACP685_004215 [Escherichia coli]|jgi:hypothetical protein|nr:MAG TPA: HD domain-containing protein [Caudoviricetes sp.]